jgi:hypothetical protein
MERDQADLGIIPRHIRHSACEEEKGLGQIARRGLAPQRGKDVERTKPLDDARDFLLEVTQII